MTSDAAGGHQRHQRLADRHGLLGLGGVGGVLHDQIEAAAGEGQRGQRSWASPHMNSSGPSLRSSNQSHAIVIISGSRSISVTSFGRASRVEQMHLGPAAQPYEERGPAPVRRRQRQRMPPVLLPDVRPIPIERKNRKDLARHDQPPLTPIVHDPNPPRHRRDHFIHRPRPLHHRGDTVTITPDSPRTRSSAGFAGAILLFGLGGGRPEHAAQACEGRSEGGKPPSERHRGCIRIAPSSRIVSPFSIAFSMMCAASAAYSSGWPRRGGNGTCAPSEARIGSGRRAEQRRLEDAGRDGHHANPQLGQVTRDRQRHARRSPPLEAE